MPIRNNIEISEEDAALYDDYIQQAASNDRFQYVYKIKLNSFYGALTNKYFRFYDLRMGESTTGTGRAILRHQCAKANESLTGEYDIMGEAIIYGDSVAEDTIVETNDGPIKIQELTNTFVEEINDKFYYTCSKLALTYNKQTGQNEFRRIKYVMKHKVNKKMYRVWFGNTRYVDITEDHSLIGYANSKSKTPGLVEVKPTELGQKNINSCLLSASLPTSSTFSMGLSPEMYQLIGYIIGDGHVEKKKESGVGLSVGRDDKQEVVEKLVLPLIEQGWFTSFIEMKNGHDIRLIGTKGWKFLHTHLYTNSTKHFPSWAYQETPQNIAYILKGYFSADGFANKNKTIGLCSVNKEFIYTANRLLKICGVASNYWIETTENSFKGKPSGTYTTRLTIYDAVKFGKSIGFIQTRKNNNIRHKYTKSTQHQSEQTGYVLISPTKIEEIQYEGYVYDIEVDETHMFYANDILVHNTDSTYFKTFATDKQEAIQVADAVAEKVNNSYKTFMETSFLCQPKFNGIIKAGREIVSDRGIFVEKKRYILHVVDSEGTPVDKVKTMGLELKKTTLPKAVSKELTKFIEKLLKGASWESVCDEIIAYRKQLKQGDITLLGLPKGVKKVEDYTKKYEEAAKIGDIKTAKLPGHVAASILWNKRLEQYDDKVSPQITTGMKIRVYYLTRIMDNHFKSIALPVDLEVIPDWFLKEFSPIIDAEAQVERLVDAPLEHILNAIGKHVPSEKEIQLNDLFTF